MTYRVRLSPAQALPNLVPPLGALNQYLPYPLPMGHIVSIGAYAYYKGADDGTSLVHGLVSVGFAVAALEAGVVGSVVLNFVVKLSMTSMYFYAKIQSRSPAKAASQPGKATNAAAGKPKPRKSAKKSLSGSVMRSLRHQPTIAPCGSPGVYRARPQRPDKRTTRQRSGPTECRDISSHPLMPSSSQSRGALMLGGVARRRT